MRRAPTPGAVAFLAALALLGALPLAPAQEAPAGPAVSFLVYHAPGGRDADPLASVTAPPPPGSERLPATFFDGIERADPAPENAPERALAHYREFQRRLLSRENAPPGIELRVEGALTPGALQVRVEASGPAEIQLVVFEHGALSAGQPRPYVVRFVDGPTNQTNLSTRIQLRDDWAPERLGVVAIARHGDEVIQSATWTLASDTPTVQIARSVLIEHVTASWCGPCAPADEALALLATQRGVAGALASVGVQYLRAPDPLLYVGLTLGGLAAIVALRRRAG